MADSDVSIAACPELAENPELVPDSEVSVAACPKLAEDSELIANSDVRAAVCPELAGNPELMPDGDVSVAACPKLAEDSEFIPDSDVPAAVCPELAEEYESMPDSDVPAPVVDVVSGLDTEGALPIAVPVTIVAELSEAPSSDDNPVYDPVFMLDMTLLVESFDDEEYTSEVDPLEIRPVVMSPCELLGFEVDVGPPSLDVLPGAKPAVAELPPLVSRVEEITIVVKDDAWSDRLPEPSNPSCKLVVDVVDPVCETAEVDCTDNDDVESSLLVDSLPETNLLIETEVTLIDEIYV